MKKIFLVAMVLIWTVAITCPAQNMANTQLTWTVDGLNDLGTGQSASYHCTFSSNGNQAITWSQKNGNFVTTLSVQNVSGTWTNVNLEGQLLYTVSTDGKTGTLKFYRDSQGLFITIDFPRGDTRLNHRYTVTSVN